LLIHSINAAASAFEMRRPFASLQDAFAVHALDLLGYGLSDRPARQYHADDYVEQIVTLLGAIGGPTTVIASSLGGAYAISAAARRPDLVRSLVLVCPTGMQQLAASPGATGYAAYRVLRGPVGRGLYAALTSRAGVRLFLGGQAYYNKRAITPETLDGFYQTCRFPGAYYAPICFLSNLLNCSVRESFPRLDLPSLLVWGAQATTTPLQQSNAFLAANPHSRLQVIDQASLLVQDEQPAAFDAAVRAFLAA
jgi:pimeloyl-ACP methyl ester carboxylesterase